MSHTKGPWRAEEREDAVWDIISQLGLVARCPEFEEQDARLISAAPELLATTQLSRDLIESLRPVFALMDESGTEKVDSILASIDVVIAKATGK